MQGTLYIQLGNFPLYYLLLAITDQDFRYALISVQEKDNSVTHELDLKEIVWLNVALIHGEDVSIGPGGGPEAVAGQKRKRDDVGRDVPARQEYPTPTRFVQ